VAEARQPRAGADGAHHEARPPVPADLLDRLARQLGGAAVDLDRAVLEPELAQRERRAAEAVGLDRVRPGPQVAQVISRIRSGRLRFKTSEQFSWPQ
jgi:hypothetical protein